MTATPLLELEDVSVSYPLARNVLGRVTREKHVLHDVSFGLDAGEILGLVGESGSGKSTLVQAILGLRPLKAGTVRFNGKDMAAFTAKDRKAFRSDVQIVFQDPQSSLDPRLRIWQLISEPAHIQDGLSTKACRALAGEMAGRVGLAAESLDRFPHEFSGGQRQRIAIARALATGPRLVVLDEPTSALDVSVQAQILNLLLNLQREDGIAMILVSHDIGVIRHMSDRLGVMYEGRLLEIGPTGEVLDHPQADYSKELFSSVAAL